MNRTPPTPDLRSRGPTPRSAGAVVGVAATSPPWRLGLPGCLLLLQVLGWIAAGAATVTSVLPAHFTPGVAFGVQLTATPDAGTSVYLVEETPPTLWVVSSISHGGTFDAAAGAVKWGPFLDATPRVLSYQIQPPTGAAGTNRFAGRATFDAALVTVGGARESVKFPGTLARTLPVDYLPAASLTVTLAATPAADVVVWAVEEAIPSGWVLSAISHDGGFDPETHRIRWGPFLDAVARTLSFTLASPAGARTNVEFRAEARFDDATLADAASLPIRASQLTRVVPATYTPGVAFTSSLTLTPAPFVATVLLEEDLPAGWTPTDVTGGGVWDPANRKLKWGPFAGPGLAPANYTYRLTPANDATAPLPLNAIAIFDDRTVTRATTVTRLLANPTSTLVRALPPVYRPGQALTVTNRAAPIDTALVYAVEDSVPPHWNVSGISHGGTFDAVNRRVKWGPYFDATATVRVLTYQATPPGDAFGTVTFQGSGRFDGVDVITGGPASLANAPATVVRALPFGYRAGVGFQVTLTASPVPGVTTYAVEERVPTGWAVTAPSDGGAFDAVNQKVKWGPFLDANLRPLTYTITPPPGTVGTHAFAGLALFNGIETAVTGPGELAPTFPRVVGRRIFYNQSAWDGNAAAADARDDAAIATDKTPLLTGQKAGFANYTSYTRGINGIMVDLESMPDGVGPTAADFAFRIGNNGTVGGWAAGPAPSATVVRRGAGEGGSDRVTVVWAAGAIAKRWLQIRVKATAATGLSADDVFYFGNAVGETGDQPGVNAIVNATDEILARSNPRSSFTPAPVTFRYDFNRDRLVNATDQIAARLNTTSAFTALQLITPAVPGAPALAGRGQPEPPDPREDGREAPGPFGIVTLQDGRVVVYARGAGAREARLERSRLGAGWEPDHSESGWTGDEERYWLPESSAAVEGMLFRLAPR